MKANHYFNGSDYLMLGFDYELRRRGFAGNSCQIVLDLDQPISAQALQDQLRSLAGRYPVLNARPGGWLKPRWKLPRAATGPTVRIHRHEPALQQRLFNEPLATNQGELMRFDLIEQDKGKTRVAFTWTHALMDAPSAEYFLALVGGKGAPLPETDPKPPPEPHRGLKERC